MGRLSGGVLRAGWGGSLESRYSRLSLGLGPHTLCSHRDWLLLLLHSHIKRKLPEGTNGITPTEKTKNPRNCCIEESREGTKEKLKATVCLFFLFTVVIQGFFSIVCLPSLCL